MWKSLARMFLFSILTGLWFFVFFLAYEAHHKVSIAERVNGLQNAYLMGMAQCNKDKRT